MKAALYIENVAATFVTFANFDFFFYSILIARVTYSLCRGKSGKADNFFLFTFRLKKHLNVQVL